MDLIFLKNETFSGRGTKGEYFIALVLEFLEGKNAGDYGRGSRRIGRVVLGFEYCHGTCHSVPSGADTVSVSNIGIKTAPNEWPSQLCGNSGCTCEGRQIDEWGFFVTKV